MHWMTWVAIFAGPTISLVGIVAELIPGWMRASRLKMLRRCRVARIKMRAEEADARRMNESAANQRHMLALEIARAGRPVSATNSFYEALKKEKEGMLEDRRQQLNEWLWCTRPLEGESPIQGVPGLPYNQIYCGIDKDHLQFTGTPFSGSAGAI